MYAIYIIIGFCIICISICNLINILYLSFNLYIWGLPFCLFMSESMRFCSVILDLNTKLKNINYLMKSQNRFQRAT